MPFNVLVVASEKELGEFVPYVQAAKKYVGPIRVFKEYRSVQACEQAQEAAASGGLHVALLSNHFTAPGKAEFSDALRKVLRDQFHETPIVCWGHPSRGGDKGKHYHHALQEFEEVGPMLAKIKNKELVAEWKEKGEKKGLFGRRSIDR
ncbi:hypothetical protein DUNSADRAFT_4539 [Dunaliella salina]|uniref:Uncharacterized protein n=1 Tax=Dunaliella salina TaxID=3046 RepID=A0ABQ7GRU1_DUNSA|nr:hypothetical protein DUNSADRAFT_4539 [Dunaliella salina]|eukprot:KAF5837331.1 hypothetical protein DUNSADRAFT_4539 [Dunaliella salina]